MEKLMDRNSDVVFLEETWLQSNKNSVTAEMKTFGYKLWHDIRSNRDKETGGGVGIMVKMSIPVKQLPAKHYVSFEHTIVKLPLANKKMLIMISIYRLLDIAVSTFFDEMAELLDQYAVENEDIIIAGDINIHMETESTHTKQFTDLLQLYNLKENVFDPTHEKGHTLDVIVTPNKEHYIHDIEITDTDLSDHFLIDFSMTVERRTRKREVIQYRSVKTVDRTQFNTRVIDELTNIPETRNLAEMVGNYTSTLKTLVDEFCPLKKKTIKVVPNAQWFDIEYANIRRERRKAEKRYRRTGMEADKRRYIALRKEAIRASFEKKKKYVAKKLEESSGRTLYSVVNELIDNKKEKILPTSNSDKELADKFIVYFQEKIDKIRKKFTNPNKFVTDDSLNPDVTKMHHFEPATLEEITDIAKSFGVKCSPEDPVPSSLIDIDTFAPYWLKIVNLSLEVGDMESLKMGVLLPAIKELSNTVDAENFKNYRPITNLLFVSKLIERVVQTRLEHHMVRNRLMSDKNYAYMKKHSTEHLLLKVVNDLYLAFDKNQATVVVLLDLSAAFDTVDHDKLLHILEHEIGIMGIALKWFSSFLKGRSQKVMIGEEFSDIYVLLFGVPQGSVLGPILFKIYIRSLYKYVESTKFTIEGFADDHQLTKRIIIEMQEQALGEDIRNLMSHIALWMNEYFLCLNQGKTNILVMAPPSVQPEIIIRGVFIERACIRFVNSAKNLGVVLDSVLSFEDQITKVVQSCNLIIKKLSQIKGFLSKQDLQQLVSSHVFSYLDYCNSLYYGINSDLITKLQRVQNCAARLVSKNRISNNSLDDVFMELHWLKVKFRSIYKTLLIVHNCLHNNAPNETIAMLQYGDSSRTMNLRETRCSTKYGDRAFSHVGPKLWNLIPINIREEHDTDKFKKLLKTFLMIRGEEFLSWIKRQ